MVQAVIALFGIIASQGVFGLMAADSYYKLNDVEPPCLHVTPIQASWRDGQFEFSHTRPFDNVLNDNSSSQLRCFENASHISVGLPETPTRQSQCLEHWCFIWIYFPTLQEDIFFQLFAPHAMNVSFTQSNKTDSSAEVLDDAQHFQRHHNYRCDARPTSCVFHPKTLLPDDFTPPKTSALDVASPKNRSAGIQQVELGYAELHWERSEAKQTHMTSTVPGMAFFCNKTQLCSQPKTLFS